MIQQKLTPLQKKVKLINHYLKGIKKRKTKHQKKFRKLKKINTFSLIGVNVLNSISITTLVLSFTTFPPGVIISLITSSLSSIASGVITVADLQRKINTHQTAYLQLLDLHDSTKASMLKSALDDEDLDDILRELNAKTGLILDNASNEAVSVSSSDSS